MDKFKLIIAPLFSVLLMKPAISSKNEELKEDLSLLNIRITHSASKPQMESKLFTGTIPYEVKCSTSFSARKQAEEASYINPEKLVKRYLNKDERQIIQQEYNQGSLILEWSWNRFLFKQYCNSGAGQHTLAAKDLEKKVTYYKQQRFDKEGQLTNRYADSKYQIEYWPEQGGWVVESPDIETEYFYRSRHKALKNVKKLGKSDPFYVEPLLFAHPNYLDQVFKEDEAAAQPRVSRLSTLLHSYLMLTSSIMPALSNWLMPSAASFGGKAEVYEENEKLTALSPAFTSSLIPQASPIYLQYSGLTIGKLLGLSMLHPKGSLPTKVIGGALAILGDLQITTAADTFTMYNSKGHALTLIYTLEKINARSCDLLDFTFQISGIKPDDKDNFKSLEGLTLDLEDQKGIRYKIEDRSIIDSQKQQTLGKAYSFRFSITNEYINSNFKLQVNLMQSISVSHEFPVRELLFDQKPKHYQPLGTLLVAQEKLLQESKCLPISELIYDSYVPSKNLLYFKVNGFHREQYYKSTWGNDPAHSKCSVIDPTIADNDKLLYEFMLDGPLAYNQPITLCASSSGTPCDCIQGKEGKIQDSATLKMFQRNETLNVAYIRTYEEAVVMRALVPIVNEFEDFSKSEVYHVESLKPVAANFRLQLSEGPYYTHSPIKLLESLTEGFKTEENVKKAHVYYFLIEVNDDLRRRFKRDLPTWDINLEMPYYLRQIVSKEIASMQKEAIKKYPYINYEVRIGSDWPSFEGSILASASKDII